MGGGVGFRQSLAFESSLLWLIVKQLQGEITTLTSVQKWFKMSLNFEIGSNHPIQC